MKEFITPEYRCRLAPWILSCIDVKRKSGYLYNNEALFLKRFDRFVIDNGFDTGHLGRDVVEAWMELKETESVNSRNYRVAAVRILGKHMQSFGQDAYVAPPLRGEPRPLMHYPSRDEIIALFKTIDAMVPKLSLRHSYAHVEVPIILRLCYCLGMRVGECVNLRMEDVDLLAGRILITHSKGDKHRYVYPRWDMIALLQRYLCRIRELAGSSVWVFPSQGDLSRPISRAVVSTHYREAWKRCCNENGISYGAKDPTVHALRHSFTVHRINGWAEEEKELSEYLPYLSRHLGHSGIQESYYYYHLLDSVSFAVRMGINNASRFGKEAYEYHEEAR